VGSPASAPPATAVAGLTAELRHAILAGVVPAGARLVERELVERHAVARVTVRAALRALEAEGLVTIEPHRGARVAALDLDALAGLFELRTALEVEAARLALARTGGATPAPLRAAVARLSAVARAPRPDWAEVTDAHEGVHGALVDASGSARIARAHRALTGELRLFMLGLREQWSAERTAEHHETLLVALEREGPEAVRRHLDDGRAAVAAGLAPAGPARRAAAAAAERREP
jgi:DNA-binding GntR family transcriptional regulator